MRRTAQALAALGVLFLLVPAARAGEDEAAAIIDKAIKAHFPKGVDKKNTGLRTKGKGTLHVQGVDVDFTQEIAIQAPNKLKDVKDLTAMGKSVTVTSIYNGKEAWIRAGDMDVEVTKDILAEFEEATYAINLMQGLFVKDKGVKLATVGEIKVKDKPAVGVSVSREGKKDINLFFDKETGLIVKVELRTKDPTSGEEVTEERFITEYQEVGGRKVAKKVEVLHDGKAFLELDVTEVQIVEKIDDSEFAKPK
jgi:hypothetical protein